MSRTDRAATLLRALVHEARAEKVTFLAGSIAYHAFVSLLPLLVLLVTAIAAVGDRALLAALRELVAAVLTEGTSDLFMEELRRGTDSTGLTLLGTGFLLWGTLRIFRGLDTAFSDVYETESANTFLDQLVDGATVLVAFAAAVVVGVAVYEWLPTGSSPAWGLLRRVLLVGGLAGALFPLYYVFPDADVSVVEVLPGTAFAAVGLTVFESLFRLYSAGDQNVITGILLLLTWLYVSGLVVLLGAVVNAVLANRSADVDVDPVFGGALRGTAPESASDPLADGLTRLGTLLDEAEAVAFTVDGETITLPAPRRVEATTEPSPLDPARSVGLELRWSSTAAADADDAGASADEPAEGDPGSADRGRGRDPGTRTADRRRS